MKAVIISFALAVSIAHASEVAYSYTGAPFDYQIDYKSGGNPVLVLTSSAIDWSVTLSGPVPSSTYSGDPLPNIDSSSLVSFLPDVISASITDGVVSVTPNIIEFSSFEGEVNGWDIEGTTVAGIHLYSDTEMRSLGNEGNYQTIDREDYQGMSLIADPGAGFAGLDPTPVPEPSGAAVAIFMAFIIAALTCYYFELGE